ncbi:MAG: histidine phosphatase family protein [Ilumatobacter sp.]|jgi:broad specificity phosphatase PhoE|uniref:histidine phosphatase family protein n=1 Tax=Ilumatobacter sp. TaxID=1967498 RepID=UPI00391A1249
MTVVHLVRHGRATAGWDTDPDPGLDDLGRQQAIAVADRLAESGPLVAVTSPLRRCRETAQAYLDRTGASDVLVADAVAEIPSPDGYEMSERVDWLRSAMRGSWGDLDEDYRTFRDGVVAFVRSQANDAVVFSHFVAINAVIGACLDDDRLVIRSLDNCSVTSVEVTAEGLVLLSGGAEADTLIR